MGKVNTSPLSGTRDFLPLEVLRRKYVVEIIEQVYQSYGFEPLETPTMERLETLLGKYGEEGDQLIFRVLKRGEKLGRILTDTVAENDLADAGLRYDLTVPLARVAAEYASRFPAIFKRYQIQPVFRADRPAKGRFREFFQCDLDIVGSTSQVVETEVLAACAEVLGRLGFKGSRDFRIRLNHRAVLRSLMHAAGVEAAKEETALVALDKLDKIGSEGVLKELLDRGIPSEVAERLLRLPSDIPAENPSILDWLKGIIGATSEGSQAVDELGHIVALSQDGPAESVISIDPYLARGLSYYTGPIFELEIKGFGGSAGGGGRYDGLIGMFSGRQVPACGFSLGLERLLLILEERDMFPARLAGQPQALVTQFDETTVGHSLALARRLRGEGFRIDVYPEPGKYGKQFKYAEQRGIRFVLLVGPREQEAGIIALRDLVGGEQVDVPLAEIGATLRQRIEQPES